MTGGSIELMLSDANMTMPKDNEAGTVLGPKSKVSAGLVIGIVGIWLTWVTNELNTIKSSVISRNESVIAIQGELKFLNKRMDDLYERGSAPISRLQESINRIGEELRVHEAATTKQLQREPKP